MRSRYSAYAGGRVDYVIATTDPAGPAAEPDLGAWRASIRAFSQNTEFVALQVLEAHQAGDEGQVRFRAELRQGGADASFIESSRFVRRGGRWLYHSGEPEPR